MALVFYCSECGKRADEFCDLSHEDCPEQTVIRCGHNIRTMSVSAQKVQIIMWKRMELSLDAAKYLRGTHTAWSCVRDGVYIVTVLPNGTEPSANDGGYYNLTTALTVKGMKP